MGSMLVGPVAVIQRARMMRKLFGGGWRQSGWIAACAEYALEHNLEGLPRDAEAARWLAEALTAQGWSCTQATNMVWVSLPPEWDCERVASTVAPFGFLVGGGKGKRLRLVLHHQNRDAVQGLARAFGNQSV